MKPYVTHLIAFIIAFVISSCLIPLVRRFALWSGRVAKPREDRWHSKPTALLGGIGIFFAYALALAITALFFSYTVGLSKYLPLLGCGTAMFLLGLADDLYQLSPQTKLVGQIVIASVLVFFGFKINWFTSYTLNTFVSVLWLVGITNAFNLLDNMDGLAAGIAFISGLFLAILIVMTQGHGFGNGQVVILSALLGSLLGFLLYNFHPASIFMGDSGSLFLGFVLAGATAHQQLSHSTQLLPIIVVPLLIVFIPIWDTGFVSIMRTLFGRSVARGGRDHASHRMVAIGLPEKKAVLTLYGFAFAGGVVAMAGILYGLQVFCLFLFVFLLVSLFFWLFLAKVHVYPIDEKTVLERSKVLTTIWVDFTYKRRLFEVTLDVFLVSFAYWASYFLRYEESGYGENFQLFLNSFPIVLACSVFSYFAFGVYKGVWRYTGVSDLITYLKAVAVGVVLSISAVFFLYQFGDFSRSVFVIFFGMSFFFLAGSRLSFRVIAEFVQRNAVSSGKRVLIYGAGDKGEMALREIVNNPRLGLTPVGFIDDDIKKHKRKIKGYRILGGRDRLADFIPKYRINELIVASRGLHPDNFKAACNVCTEYGVTIRNLELSIQCLHRNMPSLEGQDKPEQEGKGGLTLH